MDSKSFKTVVDDCTLCDTCFLNKCPYVPPHGLNIDFPHLMLRYKAVENMEKNVKGVKLEKPTTYAGVDESTGFKMEAQSDINVLPDTDRTLKLEKEAFFHSLYTNMDLMNKVGPKLHWLLNFVTQTGKKPNTIRRLMEGVINIDSKAELPRFVPEKETLLNSYHQVKPELNKSAPAFQKNKKVVLFATCNVNSSNPQIGRATVSVLKHNGVDVKVVYDMCCGMPQFESGKLKNVSERAERISKQLRGYIDEGYDIITPVSSCTLMFKKEWPLLVPDNEDVKILSQNTYDVAEYIVKLNKEGLLLTTDPYEANITLHHACHSRAQSVGFKSKEMLSLIPNVNILSIERCSGHGGSFGVQKGHHDTAMKVGKPVFTRALSNHKNSKESKIEHYVSSECPLASKHIKQGMTNIDQTVNKEEILNVHPIEILAKAYKLEY